jgi:ADP-ribose pyrophosphatase YjhB (NUDIX family)
MRSSPCNLSQSLTCSSRTIGQWSFPGGHLDQGEDLYACAERETFEETGLEIRAEKVVAVTNDVFEPSKHYVTVFMKCERIHAQQQPQVRISSCFECMGLT